MKKYLFGALFSLMILSSFTPVQAQTIDELKAQIQVLLQQIQTLQANQSQTSTAGTVSATTAVTASSFNQNIGYGMTNSDDVRRLQDFLRSAGYFSGESSGNFYGQTFEAVKRFQTARGVEATGFVGPQTRALMNSSQTNIVETTNATTTDRVSFSAYPTSIVSGQSSTLTLASMNMSSCTVSGISWESGKTSGYAVVYPTQTTSYTATCENDFGKPISKSVTVTVGSIGLASPTISASRTTIQSGESSILYLGRYPITASTWKISFYCPIGVTISQKAGGCTSGTEDSMTITSSMPTSSDWPVSITNLSGSTQAIPFTFSAYASTGKQLAQVSTQITVYPGSATSTPVSLRVISPNGGEAYNASNQDIKISYTSSGIEGKSLTAYLYHPVNGYERSIPAVASSNGVISLDIQKVSFPLAGQYKINLCADTVSMLDSAKNLCDLSDNYFTIANDTRPRVTFTPDQATIMNNYTVSSGQSVTLQWSSPDATSCTFEGSAVSPNGTRIVTPTSTRDYYITCVNSNGSLVNGQYPQTVVMMRLNVNTTDSFTSTPLASDERVTQYDYPTSTCGYYSGYTRVGSPYLGRGPVYTNSAQICGAGYTPDDSSYRAYSCSVPSSSVARVNWAFKCKPTTSVPPTATTTSVGNSTVKSLLSNVRTAASRFYTNNNNAYPVSTMVVSSPVCTGTLFMDVASGMANLTGNSSAWPSGTTLSCQASFSGYAVSALLPSAEGVVTHWCVDSSGVIGGSAAHQAAGDVTCSTISAYIPTQNFASIYSALGDLLKQLSVQIGN